MRIALVSDTYAPQRTSGAVQLRDLAIEMVRQGHSVTVLTPAHGLENAWRREQLHGVDVLRLRAPRTKDVGYVRRTMAELAMPYQMSRNLGRSPLGRERWEGIVWYSPSIFLGPLVSSLKRACECRSYLVLRDIFPDWAKDMGLIRDGLPYRFFAAIANYQYSLADAIGVQSQGNVGYLLARRPALAGRVEVLNNWLAEAPPQGCSIDARASSLAGRRIFVYAGNMGIAQGMDILLALAERLSHRSDVGFLFVGRGSGVAALKAEAFARGLQNVLFFDEIDPSEIPGLYAQCHIGLVALDPRHSTHNIPGKFLSYMRAGLPVLARINPGNDLVQLIEGRRLGMVCTSDDVAELESAAEMLLSAISSDEGYRDRCREVGNHLFSPESAASQVIGALSR